MANTFIQLNDTPGQFTGKSLQFVRVNAAEDGLSFSNAELDSLIDTQVSGAYAPRGGQVLQWNAGVNKWRPETNDPYSAGNGLIKNAATLDVVATGGLVANSSGVYIEDIANVAGTYGAANSVPVFTVNTKGQIVDVENVNLVADSAQTITNDFVGNVLGTAGQIRVTGGTGNNSNATIDLVATGVTAATYGNATHAPQITVDTYGRIQNVEMIEMAGGGSGNVSGTGLNYQSIVIDGQTTVSADQENDTLTLVAGSGIQLTTNASADAITISSDATMLASSINANDLADINTTGITNGQVIRWVAANSAFEPYTIPSNSTDLTSFSAGNGLTYDNTVGRYALDNSGVIEGTYGNEIFNTQITVDATGRVTNISNVMPQQSGVTAGTYGSGTTIPQITVDALGRVTDVANISSAQYIQSLSWNATNKSLTLSSGNTVDLSVLADPGFKTVDVQGKGSLSADAIHDTLTFVGGIGINLEVDSVTDTITIENAREAELSGVTAGAYGSPTEIPRFAVDERGRITDVILQPAPDELQTLSYDDSTYELTLSDNGGTVDLSGLYNEKQGFSIITSPGEQNIVAERELDSINIVGGEGVNVTLDPATDTITITATGSSAANISGSSIADLNDVGSLSGITNGQALVWNSTNNRFEPGTVASSGGPTLNAGDGIIIGSNVVAVNNTVVRTTGNQLIGGQKTLEDMATFEDMAYFVGDNTDGTLNGLFITANKTGTQLVSNITATHANTPSNNTLDATLNISADADGTGIINIDGDAVRVNSLAYPSSDGTAGQALITDGAGNLTFGTVASAYGDSDVQTYLTAQGYATQASIVAAITDSAPTTLDTLNELAAALGDDPNFATTVTNSLATKADASSLHAVATSGDFDDLTNVPVISLSGSNISFDGTTLDLSSVGAVGPQGAQGNVGPQGAPGVSISSATVTAGNLIISLSNSASIDAGNVQGPQGQQGVQGVAGSDGVSITTATINSDDLILGLSNASSINAGNVRGPVGPQGIQGPQGTQGDAGQDGTTITSASISTNNLVLTLSDSSTINAGNVRGPIGPQGPQGPQGDGDAGISSTLVNGSGNLIVTLNDATTLDAGNIKGDKGDTGDTGIGITNATLVGANIVLSYSNTSTQDLGNVQGPAGPQGAQGVAGPAGPAGPQGNIGPTGNDGTNVTSGSVNGSGNLILTLSDASTIDAGNVRGADGTVDQTLSLGGNVITISGSGSTVDLTTLLGAYINTDAQSLNLSGNTLSISGGNSVDLTSFAGGGGTSYADSDVDTHLNRGTASSGQVLTWNGSDYAWTDKTVDTDTDAQTLSLAGNTITISGSSSSVDLTPILGSGSGGIALTDLSGGTGVDYDNTTGEIALASSGVSAGTYGSSTLVPRITVDNTGRVTSVTTQAVSGGGGGGGSGSTVERFKLNYASNGTLASTSDLSSGIASATIDSASGGDMTITFNGFNFPPAQILIYGYVYASNKYTITPFESTMGLREIAGGGSTGSPTLFNGASTPSIKLRLREAETGASRSFGTVTHAWIQFVMYD